MPAGSGRALLAAQQLNPSRPNLVDILSWHGPMLVLEAVDDAAIAINHVYIIPPNSSMTVAQWRLTLMPQARTLWPLMPVYGLLESLARDQGPSAIGMVLSGAGSDGAIGLQAEKTCGGTTFAQDARRRG